MTTEEKLLAESLGKRPTRAWEADKKSHRFDPFFEPYHIKAGPTCGSEIKIRGAMLPSSKKKRADTPRT